MGLAGQLLGGGIGFVLGGPIGAILGAVIGGSMEGRSSAGGSFTGEQNLQATYFTAAFSMLGKMAAADGNVSQDEARLVEDFTRRQMRLDERTREFAMKIFHEASGSDVPFEALADQFYQAFTARPEFLRSMLDMLLQVSIADRKMHPNEDRILKAAAERFRIPQEEFIRMREQYMPDTDRHYAVLGCDPQSSMDEIKTRYRRLVQDYHPDKITAKGLPEEFSQFAAKKFHEIQEAYEAVKKERAAV